MALGPARRVMLESGLEERAGRCPSQGLRCPSSECILVGILFNTIDTDMKAKRDNIISEDNCPQNYESESERKLGGGGGSMKFTLNLAVVQKILIGTNKLNKGSESEKHMSGELISLQFPRQRYFSTCFDSTIFILVLSLAILPSGLLRACITKSQQPWYDRLVVAHPTALGSASQHAYNRDSPASSCRILCLHTKECTV